MIAMLTELAISRTDITQTNSKILFSNIGKLISAVDFVTIRAKFDLKPLQNENEALCNTAKGLKKETNSPDGIANSCDRNKIILTNATWDDIAAQCKATAPWKNTVKTQLIQASIAQLEGICEDNSRKIDEIKSTFHLEDLDTSSTNPPSDSTDDHNRPKRQIITGLIVGVVTSLISTFTTHQLLGMTSSSDTENALIDNQEHIMLALAHHDTRLTRDEYEIKQLKDHLTQLDLQIAKEMRQNTIMVGVSVAITLGQGLKDHIANVQSGLYTLLHNK